MTIYLSYLSKTNDNKMASASSSINVSLSSEDQHTYNVNDSIISPNTCRCHRCHLDSVLEALPRQMNQYIRLALPENLGIYRRINAIIDRIIELMCPKDYCFIRKDYPWDWFEAILGDIQAHDIFIRWQMAILPNGREVSIFVDLDTYEKATEHFEEIRAILFPIFKGIQESEEGLCHYVHPYTRDAVRQDIVRKCWDKFLQNGYTRIPIVETLDTSSIDSDEMPALEEVSDIEFDDEGEVQFVETEQSEDEDEDEDEDSESEDDSTDSESEDEENSDSDDDEEDEKESLDDRLPEVCDIVEVDDDGNKYSLETLHKQGKISVTFKDIIDSIKHIEFTHDKDNKEAICSMNISFVLPLNKDDIVKKLFCKSIESVLS